MKIHKISSFTKQMFMRQYLPAISSALVLSVADMADALVVGNRMGAVGLAAIAFAIPVFMIYNVIAHSFGLGGAVVFSKKMTKGKEEEARQDYKGVLVTIFILGIGIAILGNVFVSFIARILGADPVNQELFAATVIYLRFLFAAAPFFFFGYTVGYYMRNDDLYKESSVASQIGNGCDFSLNIILVLFCGLGVMGAALATLIGIIITSTVELFFIYGRQSHLKIFRVRPNFKNVFTSYKTGFSSCITYIYTFVFIWIGNNALFKLSGEIGVAVFEIVQSLSYLMGYVFNAISMAAQPVLSTYEAECNYKESDDAQILVRDVGIITSVILGSVIIAFAAQICMLFGIRDEASISYGVYALRAFGLCVLFAGFNILLANIYTARDIPLPAFIISTLRGFVILVPVMLLFIFLGEKAFWYTYFATELISFIIVCFYVKFFMKKTKRLDADKVYTTTLHGKSDDLGDVLSQVEGFLEKWEADPKQMYYVQMTIEEVCSAIINMGFSKMQDNNGLIQLTLVCRGEKGFSMHIRDNAITFNPFDMNKKNIGDIDDDDSDFNALGMDVIKKKAKSFYYRRYQGFNTMVVKI
ncbi:MAG: hypothetical protein J6I68_00855 [Butyrivibrio sp.]|uniref:MATE family efflux transporter n=1 Tax=Butyrivibrio sp. TaxID=28121 RepID=UPI001B78E95F|nr:MATE family efflux transporter [Butyrivibrio sp.]MBP3781777.1 hypothetical protein [Butyrivibrio sp.]